MAAMTRREHLQGLLGVAASLCLPGRRFPDRETRFRRVALDGASVICRIAISAAGRTAFRSWSTAGIFMSATCSAMA